MLAQSAAWLQWVTVWTHFNQVQEQVIIRRPLWGHQACGIAVLSLPPPVVLPLGLPTHWLIVPRPSPPDANPATPDRR